MLKITVPRWVQMVGLPLLVIFLWFTATLVSQVVFIFLSAGIIALMLNPLVEMLEKRHLPRFIGVALVFLTFIAIIAALLVIVIPPAIEQLQELVDSLPFYATELGDELDSWKSSIEGLNLPMDVSQQADRLVARMEDYVADLGSKAVSLSINIVNALAQIILVLVISIYMLLDAERIGRNLRKLFPRAMRKDADELIESSQKAVTHWARAQALLSLLVGVSTSIGILLLGALGVWPEGSQYAAFFGAWAGITEFIPYIGPILGAAPPVFVALFSSPWAALSVVILFVVIQQVEGNILVPNLMGTIVGVHPLVVIFAVLAGAQLHGIAGMILALPLVALLRRLYQFFKPRIKFEKRTTAELAAAAGEEPGSD